MRDEKVCIQRSNYSDISIDGSIDGLLSPLGGIKRYVKPGERVLLKVNLLSPSHPSKAVTTHPAIVGAVAEAVFKAGGIPYIGDSPAGRFNKRFLAKAYECSGLKALAEEKGIELNYDTAFSVVKIPGGRRLRKTRVCRFVLDADKIIALPKIKTHSYMGLTLATKIMFGAVPGLKKAGYHSIFPGREAFGDALLDILSVTRPALFIMDGVVGMHGNGPQSGKSIDIGIIIASEDAVAMDVSVCRIIGADPMDIPVLKMARIRGLWPSRIKYPLLSPEEVKVRGFKLPSTVRILSLGMKLRRFPVPTEKCVACGECKEICPRGAIKIKERAEVDYSLCIRCYCCGEVCRFNAIKLSYFHR